MRNEHVAEPFRGILNAVSGERTVKEAGLMDYLTYCSYRHNRKISPEITPEQWGKLFGPTEAFELRFQKERVTQ